MALLEAVSAALVTMRGSVVVSEGVGGERLVVSLRFHKLTLGMSKDSLLASSVMQFSGIDLAKVMMTDCLIPHTEELQPAR